MMLAGSDIQRSIPAWAGKPPYVWDPGDNIMVHPRVGGETGGVRTRYLIDEGPSPRGRGNLAPTAPDMPQLGSIPAWAGKPAAPSTTLQRHTVHPRVGGETSSFLSK